MNVDRVNELGEACLAMVQAHSTRLPFELMDHYERWLLHDMTLLPVALLETACEPGDINYNSNTRWQVGQRAAREFLSSPAAIHLKCPQDPARELQSTVNACCRQGRNAWYRRDTGGRGVLHPRGGEAQTDILDRLGASDFPLYGLRTDWEPRSLTELTSAYIDWLSPWLLLMWPHEGTALERRIQHAVQYPARLYRIRHLLSQQILNRKDVKSALVQAELSRRQ
jgi:hypothetical protein